VSSLLDDQGSACQDSCLGPKTLLCRDLDPGVNADGEEEVAEPNEVWAIMLQMEPVL
jgi:hypothetical protein